MTEHPLAAPLRRGYALGPGSYARASAASLLGARAEMCKVRVGASTRGSTWLGDEEVLCHFCPETQDSWDLRRAALRLALVGTWASSANASDFFESLPDGSASNASGL
jgi:hypothetical protein